VDILTNFLLSGVICFLIYLAGVIWIKVHTPKSVEFNSAYLTWAKWNAILALWLTTPLVSILLGLLFPPSGGSGGVLGLLS
jgi:hypothetical protein